MWKASEGIEYSTGVLGNITKGRRWRQRDMYIHRIWYSGRQERESSLRIPQTRDRRNLLSRMQKHSDLFICEGMYGEKDKQKKPKEYKHMTFYEAAQLGQKKQK